MGLIPRKLDGIYKRKIQGLITDLSLKNKTIAVISHQQKCNNCLWDHVHKSSSNKYNDTGPRPFQQGVCPICRGVGVTTQETQRRLQASVRFGQMANQQPDRYTQSGLIPEGHAMLKVNANQHATLHQAKYFLINGVRYTPVSESGRPQERGLLTHAISTLLVREDR